jgi:hypothetical protein
MFEPYDRIQDPSNSTREAVRKLISESKKRGRSTYIYINNRLKGNAPGTIDAILDQPAD